MTWKCVACGNRVARRQVPAACPRCGVELLVSSGARRREADPNAESLFSSWLQLGLDLADRSDR